MIKAVLMFVFGNALWDKLVEFFGSPEAVVATAVAIIVIVLVVKFFKEIVGLVVIAYILWLLLH
ncbi:MAG: hypothetical protein J5809_03740 [Selenomonadaceae bacterium]|nr:hypothetical protein [Selenomonadaceae bacterium]